MPDRSTPWKGQKGRVFSRILFEITIPATSGFAWGLLAWHQGKSLFESFSTGFAAFFFIFFLQGQVLRVNKNDRDEMNADEVRDNFVSIHAGLQELRGKKQAEDAVVAEADKEAKRLPDEFMEKGGVDIDAYDGDLLFAKPFFVEADRAFRQGTFYPAMLAAAVGFEHALREGQQLAVWEYYDSCLTNFIAYIKSGADTQIRPWLVSIAKTHIGLSENTNYAFSGLFYQLLQFPTFSRFLGEDVAHSGVRDSRPARNLAKFSRLLNKFEYPASDWSVLCSGPSWIGTFSVHCSMEGLFNGCFALL